MVDYISNSNDMLSNNLVKQQQELSGVERKTQAKNIYSENKSNDINDEGDISTEAKAMYEKEQELNKYKKFVFDAMNEGLPATDIVSLINTGKYLDNDSLADSLSQNRDFMDMLFSDKESA